MHKPFLFEIQTGLLCARKRHFFPNIGQSSRTMLAFFAVDVKTCSSGNRPSSGGQEKQNKTREKTMFWGRLGYKHVQTSLETCFIFIFWFVCLCCLLWFLLVSFGFFWFLLVFDSLGRIRINPD